MKVTYSMINDALLLDDGNFILTYGIQATDTESGEKLSLFNDVSVSKSFTQRVIDILNTCEVEICHFHDVVTDELNR